jgi:Acetyltransferases
MIKRIQDRDEKQKIARQVLEGLTEWFEVEESREGYISDCKDWIFFAAEEDGHCAGFLCLKETGKETVELAVMGVLKEYHRNGIGRQLVEKAKAEAAFLGYSFMQVKTVKMGVYEDYDRTNRFYLACGFKEFEVIETIWDEANPCQIYVMSLA